MTGENKFFKYLKIVIGFLVAILFLLPIFILLMDSFKNQKGILTDVLGWPNPFIFDNYPKAMEKMNKADKRRDIHVWIRWKGFVKGTLKSGLPD